MKYVFLAMLFALSVSPDQQKKAPMGPETALLVIDIQNFYFEKGSLPLVGSVEAAQQARRVLAEFRAKKLPVIHIRHASKTTTFVDGEPTDAMYRIRPEVAPLPGETIITKHYANSFRDTPLRELLEDRHITSLVIVGMQTHMCVEAAARAAADLGLDVTVIAEACATRPLTYGGRTVPAEMVHTAALAAINGTYGRVVGIDSWLASRQQP
ncbi:MAG: cysteine hydrolase family protein [Bacteroidales bacterium]